MGNHGYPLHVRVCRLVFFGGGGEGRGLFVGLIKSTCELHT